MIYTGGTPFRNTFSESLGVAKRGTTGVQKFEKFSR